LTAARELKADLLVLGGYGTSMTRELILGGVTRHMLTHAEIPLLMAH
jgi:nucleotide-binding universal stress UspA family protein